MYAIQEPPEACSGPPSNTGVRHHRSHRRLTTQPAARRAALPHQDQQQGAGVQSPEVGGHNAPPLPRSAPLRQDQHRFVVWLRCANTGASCRLLLRCRILLRCLKLAVSRLYKERTAVSGCQNLVLQYMCSICMMIQLYTMYIQCWPKSISMQLLKTRKALLST